MAKNVKKVSKCFADSNKHTTFALAKRKGAIAQLVEQRTENPCVPGSIPGGTTLKEKQLSEKIAAFCYIFLVVFAGFCKPVCKLEKLWQQPSMCEETSHRRLVILYRYKM